VSRIADENDIDESRQRLPCSGFPLLFLYRLRGWRLHSLYGKVSLGLLPVQAPAASSLILGVGRAFRAAEGPAEPIASYEAIGGQDSSERT
jgi:hypothetical protein